MSEIEPLAVSVDLRDRILELVPSFCLVRRMGVSIAYDAFLPPGKLTASYFPEDGVLYDEDTLRLQYNEPVGDPNTFLDKYVEEIKRIVNKSGFDALSKEQQSFLRGGSISNYVAEFALQSVVEISPHDASVIVFERGIGKVRENGLVDIWKDAHEAFPNDNNDEPFIAGMLVDDNMDEVSKMMFKNSFEFTEEYEEELLSATDRIARIFED